MAILNWRFFQTFENQNLNTDYYNNSGRVLMTVPAVIVNRNIRINLPIQLTLLDDRVYEYQQFAKKRTLSKVSS